VLAECRKKKLKVGSLQGVQRTLIAVLSQAVEDGILPGNPAADYESAALTFESGSPLRRDLSKANLQFPCFRGL